MLQASWPRRTRPSLSRAAAWQKLAEICSPHTVVGPQTPAKGVAIASGRAGGNKEGRKITKVGRGERF